MNGEGEWGMGASMEGQSGSRKQAKTVTGLPERDRESDAEKRGWKLTTPSTGCDAG